MMQNTCKAE